MAITSPYDPRTLASMLLLAAGTLVAMYALGHPRWAVPGAALAAAGVASWTVTNLPYEGVVLVVVDPGNGVTAADLLSGPALVAVAVLCWRGVRR